MKAIAIGFSESTTDFLKVLKETEFIDDIYIGSSSSDFPNEDKSIMRIITKNYLKENWKGLDLIIFVGSIAVAVRIIAPFLSSKNRDPAIIVIDKNGSKVIPLIGSHQANAQNIAFNLSNLLGGEVVETNNSSIDNLLNLDSFGNNWGWRRSGLVHNWSKLVIKQSHEEKIFCQQMAGNDLWRKSLSAKRVSHLNINEDIHNSASTFHISVKNNHSLTWHPPTLWLGIGCERNTQKKFIEESLDQFLDLYQLSPLSIAGFATVEIKRDEEALLKISKEKDWPIKFYCPQELLKIPVPNPSEIVFNEIGTPSVAEAACLIAAGEGAELKVEKNIFKIKENLNNKTGSVTFAIAESKRQYAPSKGEIHIVGSGPGDIRYLTNDARKALSECPVWIGYKMYLDLLEPLQRYDQIRIDSELTEEIDRCKKAINLAEEGIKVAIISSGDSGIYGMAGLLLEIIHKVEKEFRPSLFIHPGISSMQLAASIAGAPLMNDFCAISLSDKLTPWETIEQRIHGALEGDFVVVIFNPQSKERNWQLKKTLEMFLNYRKKDTPVFFGRQVGREEQVKKVFKLNEIPLDDIDMLSILIIGNSKTKLVDDKFISPRGYL